MQSQPQILTSTSQTLGAGLGGDTITDDANQLVSPTSRAWQDWTTDLILGNKDADAMPSFGGNTSNMGGTAAAQDALPGSSFQHQPQQTYTLGEPSAFYDPAQEDHYGAGSTYHHTTTMTSNRIPSFSIASTSPKAAAFDAPSSFGNFRDRSQSDVSAASPFASPLLEPLPSPHSQLHDRSSSFGSDFGASPPTLFPNNDSPSSGSNWMQAMPPMDRMSIRDSSLQTSVFEEDADSPRSQHLHSAPPQSSTFEGVIPMLSVSDTDRGGAGLSSSDGRHVEASIYSEGVHTQEPSMMDFGDSYASLAGPATSRFAPSDKMLTSPIRSDSYDQFQQFIALGTDLNLDPRRKAPQRKRSLSDTGPRLPNAGLASFTSAVNEGTGMLSADVHSLGFGGDLSNGFMRNDSESLGRQSQTPIPLDTGTTNGNVHNLHSQVPSNSGADHRIAYSVAHDNIQRRFSQVHQIPPFDSGLSAEPGDSVSSWRFPSNGLPGASQQQTAAGLRRSQSARGAGGRHRGIRSEDLGATSVDFLSSITAPDGGLAPPLLNGNVGSPGGNPSRASQSPSIAAAVPLSSAGGGHGRGASVSSSASTGSRAHPYRATHDRHPSFGSAASMESFDESSPNSAASPAALHRSASERRRGAGDTYSQTSAPGYGDVMGPVSGASQALSRMELEAKLANPINAKVSTPAAQLASASRRKTDALFHCTIPGCTSTFTRQYNLRGHLRSHLDERPFTCEWEGCDKSFARSHDCKRHYALHKGIKRHMCDNCGQTFTRADGLYKHQKKDAEACSAHAARGGYVGGETSLSRNSSRSTRSAMSDNGASEDEATSGQQSEEVDQVTASESRFSGHVL